MRAMVAAAEIVAAGPSAPASGRIVIEIGKDRRISVDAAALAGMLGILEWLGVASQVCLSRSAAGLSHCLRLGKLSRYSLLSTAQSPE